MSKTQRVTYTILIGERQYSNGARDYVHENCGPFLDRAEAERAMTAAIAQGCCRVSLREDTEDVDDE